MEGRREKRNSARLQVLVSSLARPWLTEQVSMEKHHFLRDGRPNRAALGAWDYCAYQIFSGRTPGARKSCLLQTSSTQNIWSWIGVSGLHRGRDHAMTLGLSAR